MDDEQTVLVLTNPRDITADLVVQKLHESGTPVFRCDLADFPTELTLEAHNDGGWIGVLRHADREINLAEIRSIYCRRPTAFRLPADMTDDEREFAATEAQAGFTGVLMSLPCRWINHPVAARVASCKPYQLMLARSSGLVTPRSIITNDPAAARHFISEQQGPVIYKGIGRDFAQDPAHIPTPIVRPVAAEEIDESVRLTAHIFQQFVPKSHDIRLVVVGTRMFGVQIHAHSEDATLDWRADYAPLTYLPAEIPDEVRTGVARLMSHLNLVFGVLDFVVALDGTWHFLEINTNGQWAWLPEVANTIANAISVNLATALARLTEVSAS
ncbi:ATP-grasp ribosomal peptide maturase [Kribbella sp. NPDC051587]|uniref:ATP-grasp ribosomal peptide maturase n=1 Tax=Kribbella sp. NPDC051587 TaxID=3364119 RepID=UPI00378E7BE9